MSSTELIYEISVVQFTNFKKLVVGHDSNYISCIRVCDRRKCITLNMEAWDLLQNHRDVIMSYFERKQKTKLKGKYILNSPQITAQLSYKGTRKAVKFLQHTPWSLNATGVNHKNEIFLFRDEINKMMQNLHIITLCVDFLTHLLSAPNNTNGMGEEEEKEHEPFIEHTTLSTLTKNLSNCQQPVKNLFLDINTQDLMEMINV